MRLLFTLGDLTYPSLSRQVVLAPGAGPGRAEPSRAGPREARPVAPRRVAGAKCKMGRFIKSEIRLETEICPT